MPRQQRLLVSPLLVATILSLVFIPICAEAAAVTANPDEATLVMMQIPGKEYVKHLKW